MGTIVPPCPSGQSPDLLFRFPMEPFTLPYGQDCYFNAIGYEVFGVIALVNIVVVLLIHLLSLRNERNVFFKFVKVVHCILLSASIALLVVGWVAPEQTYIMGVLILMGFMTTGVIWIILGYKTVVRTIVNAELGKQHTVTSLLGGPLGISFISGSIFITYAIEMVTLVVLGVMKSAGDFDAVAVCFRLATGSISLGVGMFGIAEYILFTKFLSILDGAIASIASQTQSSDSVRMTTLKDTAKRFRLSRVVLIFYSVISTVVMGLHAAFLPLFWYLIIIHLLTLANSCLAVFFAITPDARRKLRLSLRFCRCRRGRSTGPAPLLVVMASDLALVKTDLAVLPQGK